MLSAIDVLIVGAGPTGTVLAIDLVRRGLKVRIIERNAHSFPGSRAKGLQPRTLELFHDLGVLDPVLKAGSLYPSLGIHVGPLTIPKKMMKNRPASEDVPYPNTWLIPQYATDSLLHDRLAELGGRVEFSSTLTDFRQDEDQVHATIEGPEGKEEIICKFLVGADGGASTVRETLGIDFEGKTDESDRWIIVDSEVDGLSRKYWHIWPRIGRGLLAACPLPGGNLFQWMFRLPPGEEPKLDEAALNTRIRGYTKSGKVRLHSIRWTTVFRPNIRLAAEYARGRVFIAGDAAHVHTPMGAQGLNTGVQDAYNLGWKIAQVLSGAPPALLETYEVERRPIAAAVLGRSTEKYEALGKVDAASMKRGKDEQQLLITYSAGPLGRTGSQATEKLETGDRAPNVLLQDGEGRFVNLFDLYRGPHFTAIAIGDAAADDLSRAAWPRSGAALKRIVVDASSRGDDAIHLEDPKASLRSIYGATPGTVILVRPDGYIALISDQDRKAALGGVMAKLVPEVLA